MMITLENVSREYNLDEQVIFPVDNVTLDIESGEFVMVVGRSGTGKSTLLNLTAGLIRPTSGRVAIDGMFIDSMADRELSRLRSQKIGYVFQFASLLPSLNLLENVMAPNMFSKSLNKVSAEKRAVELLDMVALSARSTSYPRNLSAGEQKRAVIARALMNRPTILLADEPTSDLDEHSEADIIQRLVEIHGTGVTILMVTHSMGLTRYADRTFQMQNGKLELLQQDKISEC